MKLVIGDKNLSSWSMRPWVLLRHFGIPFEERLIRLGQPGTKANILDVTPSGKVPCLVMDTGETVWESLAIMETLAERFAQHPLWPRDAAARAHARSISAEMHAGFSDLRHDMPMQITTHEPGIAVTPATLEDIARIDAIWSGCLAQSGGPFLFGDFCIADAMFAPVVMRFNSYAPAISECAREYAARVTALPAVAAWIDEARKDVAR
ncbi:glutathione S-transferase family protein [Caballeronia sp. LZ062]|uniref:glutathione S-transferase family protein n=1 Tax=unclassified Caballeronia TaxID=2646786 RepID=UPI002855301B|nr:MULTISPECIES: glutathione S-transferase family protein [unclassified Caballeronia]MDR5855789.1 glutathione S-transferase family protein [Caballeronia sp. LZ050]MDR5872424.1 glutathione S-transferase family protein [Caballeronia sp. LZ062]